MNEKSRDDVENKRDNQYSRINLNPLYEKMIEYNTELYEVHHPI